MPSNVNGPFQTYSYTYDYDELVTGTAGTQDAVRLHDILPPGWEVREVEIETETAFNGSGTRTINIGVTGDPDAIVAAQDVKAAGFHEPTVVKYRATESIQVTAQLVTATDSPTAGRVRVSLVLMHVAKEA